MYVLWLERGLGWGEEVSEKGSVKQTNWRMDETQNLVESEL